MGGGAGRGGSVASKEGTYSTSGWVVAVWWASSSLTTLVGSPVPRERQPTSVYALIWFCLVSARVGDDVMGGKVGFHVMPKGVDSPGLYDSKATRVWCCCGWYCCCVRSATLLSGPFGRESRGVCRQGECFHANTVLVVSRST